MCFQKVQLHRLQNKYVFPQISTLISFYALNVDGRLSTPRGRSQAIIAGEKRPDRNEGRKRNPPNYLMLHPSLWLKIEPFLQKKE